MAGCSLGQCPALMQTKASLKPYIVVTPKHRQILKSFH